MGVSISDSLTPERMRRDLIRDMVGLNIPQGDAEAAVDALFRKIRRELWAAMFSRAKMVKVLDEAGRPAGLAWVIPELDATEVGKKLC